MAELLSLRDVARLAHVQRPVVSTWRRRSRGSHHPFPEPREHRDSQEFFDRADVVFWLERTGRGNNADARADAAMHSFLDQRGQGEVDALSALLALRHLHGRSLCDPDKSVDALLDLADMHDPDDEFLLSELEQASDLAALAFASERLVEAAWNASLAHVHLVETRVRDFAELGAVALSAEARRFLLALFGPLTRELAEPTVMDPTGCAVDVLAHITAALELPALVMQDSASVSRLVRRQLVLADVPFRLIQRGTGDWSVTGPAAHLLVLPTVTVPVASSLEHLNLLEEVALQLGAEQLVLCLAPAATLTEPLEGEPLVRRDELLRAGLVRAIVRLPAGLRPGRAPEQSALWLLSAADHGSPVERRTLVADLTDKSLHELAGLADDLIAALRGADGARRRAWAHLYPVPTSQLVSSRGSLVPARTTRTAARRRSGADWVVDLRAADTAGRLAQFRLYAVGGAAETVTIAQAVERGWARVTPGRRLDLAGLPSGSVAVTDGSQFAVASLTGGIDPRDPVTVDRLALLARADVRLTEPGDVVFTVRPRPAAVIDREGGTLVLAPARILRLRRDAPLVPAQVAARINQATSNTWRAWTLPTIDPRDRAALGEALGHLANERARLLSDLAGLDTLIDDLTTAVESRQLRITKENHGPNQG